MCIKYKLYLHTIHLWVLGGPVNDTTTVSVHCIRLKHICHFIGFMYSIYISQPLHLHLCV